MRTPNGKETRRRRKTMMQRRNPFLEFNPHDELVGLRADESEGDHSPCLAVVAQGGTHSRHGTPSQGDALQECSHSPPPCHIDSTRLQEFSSLMNTPVYEHRPCMDADLSIGKPLGKGVETVKWGCASVSGNEARANAATSKAIKMGAAIRRAALSMEQVAMEKNCERVQAESTEARKQSTKRKVDNNRMEQVSIGNEEAEGSAEQTATKQTKRQEEASGEEAVEPCIPFESAKEAHPLKDESKTQAEELPELEGAANAATQSVEQMATLNIETQKFYIHEPKAMGQTATEQNHGSPKSVNPKSAENQAAGNGMANAKKPMATTEATMQNQEVKKTASQQRNPKMESLAKTDGAPKFAAEA